MSQTRGEKPSKEWYLRAHRVLNESAVDVEDALFRDSEFFDPRDLLLVKYEMVRRVQVEGASVAATASAFGFSRSGFYKTLAAWERAGLIGLLPLRPGPRGAHKLTDDVLNWIDQPLLEGRTQSGSALAELLWKEQGLRVHPRSIERALARRKKGA